jgi:hypothetical protein
MRFTAKAHLRSADFGKDYDHGYQGHLYKRRVCALERDFDSEPATTKTTKRDRRHKPFFVLNQLTGAAQE